MQRGFTLIEAILVVIVVGILGAATVGYSLSAKNQHSLTLQADQFRRDLSHLQFLAISQNQRLKLTVAADGKSYSVCSCNNAACATCTAVTDPATGEAFGTTLTDGVQFTAGTGSYYFDSLGRPATTTGLLATETTFKLNGVGRATDVQVKVKPITGFAQTTY